MVIPTRSTAASAENDAHKELVAGIVQSSLTELANSVTTMNAALTKVTGDLQGMLLQQQYLNNDMQLLKNGDGV